MKTILKLLLAAILLNATARGVKAAWDYYELKDATSQFLTFGDQASTSSLHGHILDKATELRLPLASQNISVHRQGVRTWAKADYIQTIEFFPNYPYPVKFSFQVDTYSLNPGKPEDPQF